MSSSSAWISQSEAISIFNLKKINVQKWKKKKIYLGVSMVCFVGMENIPADSFHAV